MGASRAGVALSQVIRLKIQYSDQAGNYVDLLTLPIVSIIDPNNTIIITADSSTGVIRQDIGLYYYDFTVPATGKVGTWKDMWSASINNSSFNTTFTFSVDSDSSVAVNAQAGQEIDPNLSLAGAQNVLILMNLLKARLGSEGTRRKTDSFGRYILDANGNYIMEPCNIFTNNELYQFLQASLSEFNSIPHFTQYTFEDNNFVLTFKHELTEGAFILALAVQGLREKGREFQMNDDGLSYQAPAIADYIKGYLSDFMNSYRERVKFIKCSIKPQPMGFGGYPAYGGGANPNFIRLRHLRQRRFI